MSNADFYAEYTLNTEPLDANGFNPYYQVIESGLEDSVYINGKSFIDLASNNYLGLACDPYVKQAMKEAVDRYGASMCGTPVATGYAALFKNTEERLSSFIGLEDVIILPSCYQANNGLFSAVTGNNDIVIVDHYAHSSLLQGINATGARMKPFIHNDMNSLERILKKSGRYTRRFVVTESVFSTEGAIAPFDEISSLCRIYNAIPVIDDSHGIGVLGRRGRGILEEKHIKNFNGIYTASLGKALANAGGIIAGRKSLIDYLRYYCSHLVYSTALPPAVLAGVKAVIDIINEKFGILSARMWRYKNMLTNCLLSNHFNLTGGEAPITSVIGGSTEETLLLARLFFEHRILCTPFVEPSVPRGKGTLRFIAGANLSERAVCSAIERISSLNVRI